jgi:nicotinamide-nucleotide amidase
MIQASIITIGDELLIGQVVDSNSAWIAQELNKIGVPVISRLAVGDNWEKIWNALDQESKASDIIIITGGLGPTADDITKPLLCEYFNGKLVSNVEVLQHVENLFQNIFKRPVTDRNRNQALVPDCCTILFNSKGTAPGMLFHKQGKIFISLPGVPIEMKTIMTEKVLPLITETYKLPHIAHRTLVTFGIGESMLADMLVEFESKIPNHIKLAYLPNHGIVRLRLSSNGINKKIIDDEIDALFSELKILVNQYLIADSDDSIEKIIGRLLLKNNQSVSTAESCTGGYIAHQITSIDGSSAYFLGSVVAYSYEIKESMLDVSHKTMENNGAVSEAVVREMAMGILNKTNSDYAIAVSGIMGPGGGTLEKPVGLVWIAVGNKKSILAKSFHFRFDRFKNIQLTTMNALMMLRDFIIGNTLE